MSLEGKQIDRYAIMRLLGSGGMGDVYLAEDPRIGQQVAIKVIRTELSPYPDEQAVHNAARLFQREAKAIVKLDHPHILPLYDYGEEHIGNAPIIYLVMPYRPEGSLTDWLRHRENKDLLSTQDIAQLVKQAADALQHAHEHYVIHQDVKPSNFLVRARPDAPTHPDLLLSDFGIARLTTATSSVSQSIRGTPAYMAPEQWEGEPVPATDQYALAVMTYELLTGKLPFQGGPGKLMYHHINTPPPPPSSINPYLSKELDVILLHALEKRHENRFVSIGAYAHILQQAVGSVHGNQTIYPNARYEVAQGFQLSEPIKGMNTFSPIMPRSSGLPIGSDSVTYVRPVETPSSPVTPASLTRKVVIHETPEYASQDWKRGSHHLPVEMNPVAPIPVVAAGMKTRKSRRNSLLIAALIVLVLIGGGITYAMPGAITSIVAHVFGTGSSVRATITPISIALKNTYTISAESGIPFVSKHQVGARLLSSTTSSQTRMINATGTGTTPSMQAKGFLYLANYDTSPLTLNAGLIFGPNTKTPNIEMVLDETVTIPSITGTQSNIVYVPAHVVQVGPIGNITPDGFYYCTSPCKGYSSSWQAYNYYAFTGGQDAQNYIFVQQSDINNAANTLELSNTPNPQQIIQPLIHADERLIGAPICKPNVTSDHAVGDKASTVTVSVSFTCTGEVYDYDGASAMAAQLLTNQANTQLGSGYVPVGNIKTTLTSATLTDAKSGTVTLVVNAVGVWAYQFTDAQKQALSRLIAGKTKSQAQALLVSQTGVKQVMITLAGGNGDTLPTGVSKITIVVQNASG